MKSLAVISGIGAKTPLGLTAPETGFMYRTGLPSMREAPLLDAQEECVTFCGINTLPIHALAGERALTLGIDALHECSTAQRETLSQMRLSVLCCVDEFMAPLTEGGQSCAEYITCGLRDEARQWFGEKIPVAVYSSGAGGFGKLLGDQLRKLEQGDIQAILLGGMHSDYHPARIAALQAAGRLFSRDHLDALLPGEGAGFVLLTTAYLARRLGWPIWGTIHAVGSAFERATPDNDESAFGAAGMTVALRRATELLRSEQLQIGWQLHDVGFENYRVAEWQSVMLRSHEMWCVPPRIDSLTQRMGHQGGAVLPLHLVLASEAFRRGWAPHDRVVSLSGSDSGARTAVLVSKQDLTSE